VSQPLLRRPAAIPLIVKSIPCTRPSSALPARSRVETANAVINGRIPAQDIHTILSFGRTMIEHPVDLIEGARGAGHLAGV
jgi:hypothetical protein